MSKATYDKTTKIWSGRKVHPMYNLDQNLGQLILGVMKLTPDAVTQISADTGMSVTCSEMKERIEKFAAHLSDGLGLKQGDVVGVVAANTENLAPAVFACFLLGLPVNPLAPIMVEADIVQVFGQTKPKLIICDGDIVKKMQSSVDSLKSDAKIYTVMENIDGYESVTKILNNPAIKTMTEYPEVDSNSTVLILVSSGSTSAPKGICKTHREVIACNSPVYDFNTDKTLIIFQTSPIFWFSSMYLFLYATLNNCVRVITAQPYHPKVFSDILIDYKVSLVFGPPFMVVHMIQTGFLKPLEHMKCFMIGGSALPKKVIEMLQPFLPNGIIANTYACTETNMIGINFEGTKLESCGYIDPNLMVKIVDDDGNALDNLQKGEIYTKRLVNFSGYFNAPEKTAEAFEDGWFKTGDIGYFDEEGFLYYVDRKKDLLKYKGSHIIPTEHEKLINEIKGVVSSCVVGVFDENYSYDIVHAFVIVDETSGLTEQAIHDQFNAKVDENMHLRGGVHFVKSFPLGLSGKVNKKIMRAKAAEIMNQKL